MKNGEVIKKSIHGHDVTVQHTVIRDQNQMHSIHLRAEHDGYTAEYKIEIGLTNGNKGTLPSAAEIQKELDEQRQNLANEVSWKRSMQDILDGVQ